MRWSLLLGLLLASAAEREGMSKPLLDKVVESLVRRGVQREVALLSVIRGIRALELDEDNIDEKRMGVVLQSHVLLSLLRFFPQRQAFMIVHQVTMDM